MDFQNIGKLKAEILFRNPWALTPSSVNTFYKPLLENKISFFYLTKLYQLLLISTGYFLI